MKEIKVTRWLGKVSADSGQLQDYDDPEINTYIRSLEDEIERLRDRNQRLRDALEAAYEYIDHATGALPIIRTALKNKP